MLHDHDTIVAPATPTGGAIAVVRVSGSGAIETVERIFRGRRPLSEAAGYTLHPRGTISDGARLIDDVLVSLFRAPHSYTGEDSVEISCHGSAYVVSEILRLLLDAGARMATPGEFTLRAFLAGKLDLAQAEAVADLIASSSRAAHTLAAGQLRGGFSKRLDHLRGELLHLASLLELELDFSEEDVEFADRRKLRCTMEEILSEILRLRGSFALGSALKEGIPVAIVGAPNVGKSTLLNRLLNEDRAMVSEIAGTTRDLIEEQTVIDGVRFRFIDTAGIKRRQHKLSGAEYYSSLRTQAAIERSELALVLFDASIPISDQDLKVMSTAVDAGRAVVLVFNKWDLMDEFDRQRMERLWKTEFDRVTWAQRVNLSAKTGWHTNRLAKAMTQALESWDKRIPTGKLNAFLGKIQASHPHPVRGGKQPRILFATQASSRPPRFVIFATGFLEHGYRRFLERSLREEFGFEGSPIQISVNIREKKRRK